MIKSIVRSQTKSIIRSMVNGDYTIGIWNPDGTIKCGVIVPCGMVWRC